MEQQQQHPPTEQQLPPSPAAQDVDLKKASAREDLAFLTSGAKEKRDKTLAGMKGAAHIMTHPFNKQAKEEATARTIEERNEIGSKQERIRATAHMQLLQEKAIAAGFVPVAAPGQPEPTAPGAENGSGRSPGEEEGTEDATRGPESETEPSRTGRGENESEVAASSEDKISEDSSDGSSRGRARALSQIPPDSKDYQSG